MNSAPELLLTPKMQRFYWARQCLTCEYSLRLSHCFPLCSHIYRWPMSGHKHHWCEGRKKKKHYFLKNAEPKLKKQIFSLKQKIHIPAPSLSCATSFPRTTRGMAEGVSFPGPSGNMTLSSIDQKREKHTQANQDIRDCLQKLFELNSPDSGGVRDPQKGGKSYFKKWKTKQNKQKKRRFRRKVKD